MDSTIIKNFSDPNWRLRNLYKIKAKSGEIINLVPTEAQELYLKEEAQNNIILKARQLGFSTLCLIRLLDKALFTPNTTCVIMAHKQDSVQKLFKIIKFAYEHYPKEFPKANAKYNTKSELEFDEINSRIYVTTEVRGDTVNHLHISEMAFTENAEDKFIATVAAVPTNGSTTIESTANGIGDFFFDFFNEAENKGFKKHFYPWYLASEYRMSPVGVEFTKKEREYQERFNLDDEQLAWYKVFKGKLGAKFKQEFPATPLEAFMASGKNVFDVDLLEDLTPKDPIVNTGSMLVWEHPRMGARYSMGIDSAEGISKDESSIDIIDIDTGEQVWHLSGNFPPEELAEKVDIYARRYNNAFIIPESNNHGFTLIYLLRNRGLNIYKRETLDSPSAKSLDRLGWHTTSRTKSLMITGLKTALIEKDIQINNPRTILQMKTYITDSENGKMEAAPGKHDDLVISLALAWQGIRLQPEDEVGVFETFDFNDSFGY